MAEAEELCYRVAILDRGKVIACDAPQNLKKSVEKKSIFQLEVASFNAGFSTLGQMRWVKKFQWEENPTTGNTSIRLILSKVL